MRGPAQIRRWRQLGLCTMLCLALPALAPAQSETPKQPAQTAAKPTQKSPHHTAHATGKRNSHTAKSAHSKLRSKGSKLAAKKKRGQQAIDPTRAREIQTTLIRERYMEGEPTGEWDAATQAAIQRYQSDQGWQSKTTPDSRALIKLGLGPSHAHLLNPESAMTTLTPTPTPAPAAADPKAGAKQTPPDNNTPQQ
jgi:hypothetical protein